MSKHTHLFDNFSGSPLFSKSKQSVLVDCPSSWLALFRAYLCFGCLPFFRLTPFQGLSLPFFRACFVYVLAFFSQPPEPKSAPLGHPGDPPHSLLGSLSPHCWALLCPWAWNPLSQQVRFLYPWVRFLYPWAWNPLQVRCWQS